MAKFTARGIKLNKNGAIIVSTIGNNHHVETLKKEHIGFRNPRKAKSYSKAQEQGIQRNINNTITRAAIETQRVNSAQHLKAKTKRK